MPFLIIQILWQFLYIFSSERKLENGRIQCSVSLVLRTRKVFRQLQFNAAMPKTSTLGTEGNVCTEECTVLLRSGALGVRIVIVALEHSSSKQKQPPVKLRCYLEFRLGNYNFFHLNLLNVHT